MIVWNGTGLEFTIAYAVVIMCGLIIALAYTLKGAERK